MRKQLLLGTTALLAGAVALPDLAWAEDPVRVQVRGYKNEYFGIGDADTENAAGIETRDNTSTAEFSDGEIHFKGSTELDNGLEIGVQIELEADSRGDQIDEAYAFVKGAFGQITAGGENLANYNTFWAVTAPNVGTPINSGWITVWNSLPAGTGLGFRSTGLTTNVDIGNDENAISYYSPRFAGFQFTGGFAPVVADSGEGQTFPATGDKNTQYHNAFGVGANLKESFGGVDIAVAGGYNRGSAPNNVEAAGGDDFEQVKGGINISVAGFSVGGSYANEFEGQQDTPGVTSDEGQSWDIGASYGVGPWGVSATWFHGEEENVIAVADDSEVDAIVGAVSYALGPGIKTSFSVQYSNVESDGGAESKSTMGIIGIGVSF